MILRVMICLLAMSMVPSFAWCELYRYQRADGSIVITDDAGKVPEDNRDRSRVKEEPPAEKPAAMDAQSQRPTPTKERASHRKAAIVREPSVKGGDTAVADSSRSNNAPVHAAARQFSLSDEDKCYLKIFAKRFGSKDGDIARYLPAGLTREELDAFKRELQQRYGLRDETVCASLSRNERFSSPEATWTAFKDALSKGDLEALSGCFGLRSAARYKQIYSALNRDSMKQMALDIRPIEKILMDEDTAKYRIRRTERGQEITYYIYFNCEFGNWKIDKF